MDWQLVHYTTFFSLRLSEKKPGQQKTSYPADANYEVSFEWYARVESNHRTRLRRPLLYPLSYGRVYRTNIIIAGFPKRCKGFFKFSFGIIGCRWLSGDPPPLPPGYGPEDPPGTASGYPGAFHPEPGGYSAPPGTEDWDSRES